MTFGDLVFRLRRRSQDLRMSNGNLITNLISDNGLRWSASDIISFCNDALNEASNLLWVYPTSPIARRMLQNLLVERDVELTFTQGKCELDYRYIGVIGLYDKTDKLEYESVVPERLETFKDSELYNVKSSRWFTVTKSFTSLKLVVTVNSVPASDKLYGTLATKSPVFGANSQDFAKELPLQGVDDLLETLAELKLRSVEGHFDRVGQLLQILQLYLGAGVSNAEQR